MKRVFLVIVIFVIFTPMYQSDNEEKRKDDFPYQVNVNVKQMYL